MNGVRLGYKARHLQTKAMILIIKAMLLQYGCVGSLRTRGEKYTVNFLHFQSPLAEGDQLNEETFGEGAVGTLRVWYLLVNF